MDLNLPPQYAPINQKIKPVVKTASQTGFIPESQKQIEIQQVEASANEAVAAQQSSTYLKNQTVGNVMTMIAVSSNGFFEDLFKPTPGLSWWDHLRYITTKEDRGQYLGILFICLAIAICIIM